MVACAWASTKDGLPKARLGKGVEDESCIHMHTSQHTYTLYMYSYQNTSFIIISHIYVCYVTAGSTIKR